MVMNSSEPRPVYLSSHSCDPALVPETGTDVSENARLQAAITWAYEYVVYQYGESYAFSGAIYLNNASPDLNQFDAEKQFEVMEDVQDIERTLLIRSAQNSYSLDSLEVFPLNYQHQPLDFRVLGASSSERTIRYSNDIPPAALKIRLGHLNALQIDSARGCAHAEGVPPVCLPETLNVSIERSAVSDAIQIDKLNGASGSKRGLQEHLKVLFDKLFDTERAHNIGMRLDYSYHLTESGFEVMVPVTIMPQVYSADYAEVAATTLRDWYQAAALPPGVFKIGLKIYSPGTSQIIVSLDRLLLPVDAITNL